MTFGLGLTPPVVFRPLGFILFLVPLVFSSAGGTTWSEANVTNLFLETFIILLRFLVNATLIFSGPTRLLCQPLISRLFFLSVLFLRRCDCGGWHPF